MRRTIFFASILIIISLLVTLFYHETQKASINYYLGRKYFEKGVYDKAIFFYQNALAMDPGLIDALIDLAYSYQWVGDKKKAIELFEKALTFRQDNDLRAALAQSYAWAGEYKKAISVYEGLEGTMGSVKIKKELAQVYIWDGQYDKAKNILTQLLVKHPADREAKLLLAKALQYSGESKMAVDMYEELLLGER
jgi:tetratricopeptide (TPR) repeat protein